MLSNLPVPPIDAPDQFQEVKYLETYTIFPSEEAVYSVNNFSNISNAKSFTDIVNRFEGSFELLENDKFKEYKNHVDIKFLEKWLLKKNIGHLFVTTVDEGDQLVCTLSFSLNEINVIWEIYFDEVNSSSPEHYIIVRSGSVSEYYKGTLWKIIKNERRVFK